MASDGGSEVCTSTRNMGHITPVSAPMVPQNVVSDVYDGSASLSGGWICSFVLQVIGTVSVPMLSIGSSRCNSGSHFIDFCER